MPCQCMRNGRQCRNSSKCLHVIASESKIPPFPKLIWRQIKVLEGVFPTRGRKEGRMAALNRC